MEHPASVYNTIKGMVFSIFQSRGITAAMKFLHYKQSELPYPAWVGLKAELQFYNKYQEAFVLDPIWDFGIKADFTGNIDDCNNCRIDVTTNIEFKKLSTYTSIQRKTHRMYKIAVMNHETGELVDVVDLNFPFDAKMEGRLFDIALFMPAETNRHGECRYNYYQKIITINSAHPDEDFKLVDYQTDWYIPDIHTEMQDMYDAHENDDEFDVKSELKEELAQTAKFLSKTMGRNIVACAQRKYEIFDPRTGDGEYATRIYWKHPIIEDELEDVIDVDLSSEL